jgi:aryl-alcohol dehydrogenase-like predicted oxidoreductase
MEYRKLGSSGLYVSEIGLGCNNFGQRVDEKGTLRVVDAAIEHGVTLFDTADVYGGSLSEEYLGKALAGKRHDVILATKFGMSMGEGQLMKGGSRRYIMNAVEASLRRLGTDYIDLYQLHFPDPDTPIEETLGALSDVVREGKARYVGCSNFKAYQIGDAQWTSRQDGHVAFVSAQNNMSLIERAVEDEVIPACKHFGLGMLPYFPLAGGLLTGKYKRNEPAPQGARLANAGAYAKRALSDANFDKVEGLTEFAGVRERSMLDLAFAWLLSFPEVSSVIAGATKPEQVEANVAAATMHLDQEEHTEVSKIAS